MSFTVEFGWFTEDRYWCVCVCVSRSANEVRGGKKVGVNIREQDNRYKIT